MPGAGERGDLTGDAPVRTSGDGDRIPPIRIVISYRRDDSAGHAGHLHADLVRRFGPDQVFLDIENILPGSDFTEVIDDAIHGSDVVIAMIGREWLAATDRQGRRRLDDQDDFLRMELEAALSRNVRLIPVLVQDAEMPTAADLPPTLKDFAKRNAFEISDRRWRADVDELIRLLEQMAIGKAEDVKHHDEARARERHRQQAAQRDEERRATALRQEAARQQSREQAARDEALWERRLLERLVRDQAAGVTPPVEQPPLKQPPAERPERTAALPVSGPGRGPARTTGGGGSSRSVPWLVPVAVLVALVAVIGAALAARTGGKDEGSGTAVTTTTKTVAVRSDVPWNDTGVDVEAGQSLRVVAYGTVETLKGEPARNSDPAGKPGEEQYGNNVVQGVGHGALIGRIGDGPPFAVGALYEKAAPGTGRLYLGVNDKGLENNHGQYTAELTVR